MTGVSLLACTECKCPSRCIIIVQIKTLPPCAQMESGQEAHQRMVNDKLAVAELAATALVALPPVVPLRELVDTLRACRHQAFPVTLDVKAAYLSGTC